MPLKLYPPRTDKIGTPSWTIRGTYLGVYVNRSARTRKRTIADQVLKQLEREIERGELADRATPTFSAAALEYMKAGGDRRFVRRLLEYFRETQISKIDQSAVDAAATALYPRGTGSTRNRQVYTPVSAILRRAGRKLDLVRPLGSGGTPRSSWLWPEQAFRLFAAARALDKEFEALLIVLTYTGLRLSEALALTWNDIRLKESFAYVPTTKNEEPRAVFLPAVAVRALSALDQSKPRPFRFSKSGHLYSLLRVAAIRAGVDLPERTAFHITRHTYATWMRREAGLDTKGLVATGAWKDRKSADRYEHVVVSEEAMKAALLPTPKTPMMLPRKEKKTGNDPVI
jgi:integrase